MRLEQVYRNHVEFVWRNARRLGCDDSWADDAVHEVFLVVASKLDEFTPEGNIRGWLFAITFRVVQRMRRNRSRYLHRLWRFSEERSEVPPAGQYHQQEAGRELRRILARLNDAKRAVYILSELEGMTTPEISRCLGLRPGTVDSRLRAARLEIRAWIDRERHKEGTRR